MWLRMSALVPWLTAMVCIYPYKVSVYMYCLVSSVLFCNDRRAIYISLTAVCLYGILYSWKFLREKNFANFMVLGLLAKINFIFEN